MILRIRSIIFLTLLCVTGPALAQQPIQWGGKSNQPQGAFGAPQQAPAVTNRPAPPPPGTNSCYAYRTKGGDAFQITCYPDAAACNANKADYTKKNPNIEAIGCAAQVYCFAYNAGGKSSVCFLGGDECVKARNNMASRAKDVGTCVSNAKAGRPAIQMAQQNAPPPPPPQHGATPAGSGDTAASTAPDEAQAAVKSAEASAQAAAQALAEAERAAAKAVSNGERAAAKAIVDKARAAADAARRAAQRAGKAAADAARAVAAADRAAVKAAVEAAKAAAKAAGAAAAEVKHAAADVAAAIAKAVEDIVKNISYALNAIGDNANGKAIAEGTYVFRMNRGGLVLQHKLPSSNGAPIELATRRAGAAGQEWEVKRDGLVGYIIKSNGRFLDNAHESEATNGGKVQLWEANLPLGAHQGNQQWSFFKVADNAYVIKSNSVFGHVLSAVDGETGRDGGRVVHSVAVASNPLHVWIAERVR